MHYIRATSVHCAVLAVLDAHRHLDISATNRTPGAHIDDSKVTLSTVDTSSAETRVTARDKCDAVSLPDQTHLTAVVYS